MTTRTFEANLTIRQRIAAKTPGILRKAMRMVLNYFFRLRMWIDLLGELDAADGRSRRFLWLSALAAPITALRELDSYRKPHLVGDLAVIARGIGRFDIRANTDDLLHVMASREPFVRQLLEAELRLGGTFVDGGANIGYYTLLAARLVGEQGQVVAFEMMPDTAAVLRHHVASNGPVPVKVIERALSERSGDQISASVEPGLHGQASIVPDQAGERHTVTVESITLDQALADQGRIDLLKLDLEGAEFLALSGAKSVLARTGCLVFESNDRDPRIFALLEAAGFSVTRLDGFDFVARPVAGANLEVAA